MKCPSCEGENFATAYTAKAETENSIERVKTCKDCGQYVTTREKTTCPVCRACLCGVTKTEAAGIGINTRRARYCSHCKSIQPTCEYITGIVTPYVEPVANGRIIEKGAPCE